MSALDPALVVAVGKADDRRKLVAELLASLVARGTAESVNDDDVTIPGNPAPPFILQAIRSLSAAGVPAGAALRRRLLERDWASEKITDLLSAVVLAGDVTFSDALLTELRDIREFERDRERDRREAESARRLARALDEGSEELAEIARTEIQEIRRDAPRRQDELDLVCLADVKDEPIEWLVPARIAVAVPNLIAGEPGVGKSLFAAKLAAIGSVGGVMPGATTACEPFSTLILAAEDSPARIRPRVVAAGGDPSRVKILRGIFPRSGPSGPVYLSAHLPQIEQAIERTGARLVVIDPAGAFVGPGVDAHRDHELRPVLEGLARLAERRKVAVLVLAHLNKLTGASALRRVIGGIAWVAVSRSALILARDRNENGRVVLAAIKSNLAELPGAMAFEIKCAGEGAAPYLETIPGTVETTADALVADDREERDGAVGEAVAFLKSALDPAGEWRKSAEVSAAAEEAGIATRTLKRARKKLGVERCKEGKEWMMRLLGPDGGQKGQEGHPPKGSGSIGPVPELPARGYVSAEGESAGPSREEVMNVGMDEERCRVALEGGSRP